MTMIPKLKAVLAALFLAAPALAELRQEADVKLQQRMQKTLNGAPSATPLEYGEKPNGLILERYGLEFDKEDYMLDVEVQNVGLNNQSIEARGGQPGKLTWKLGWDKTPHLFSNEARSLYKYEGSGIMNFPDPLQVRYQSIDVSTTGSSAGSGSNFNSYNSTGIRSALATAQYVPLGFTLETGELEARYRPAQDLIVEMGLWRQTRRGTKAQSASFGFSNALELAAPVDHLTQEASLGLQLAKKDMQFGLDYRFSEFTNNIPNLFFDNPKRLTDRAIGTHYSNGDGGARGVLANAPSHTAQSLSFEGGLNFSETTRLSFESGFQLWEALNPMLPYTLNSAMSNTNVIPEGASYTPPFAAADLRNRPDPNIQGRIEVYNYMFKLAAHPLSWMRSALSYETYLLENKNTQYDLPGWAVFDQTWHTESARTPQEGFRDDKALLKVDYDINSWISGDLDLAYKTKRQTREIEKLNEYEGGAGFILRPSQDFFVNVSYLGALRRARGMSFLHYPTTTDTAGRTFFTEAPGMRRADLADRNRNQGRIQAQWNPGESSVSLSARVIDDKYRQGKGDLNGGDRFVYPELFGMLSDLREVVGLDFSVPVLGSLTADLYSELEYGKRLLRASQTQNANTCGGTGTTAVMCQQDKYRWETHLYDRSAIGGIALTWLPVDKLKTVLGYDIVSTRFDGNPVGAGSSISNYRPYETSRRMQQTARFRGEYRILDSLTLAANYEYDKFDATDFAYSEVPLRNGTDAIWLGAAPIRNYYAHTVSLGMNYKF